MWKVGIFSGSKISLFLNESKKVMYIYTNIYKVFSYYRGESVLYANHVKGKERRKLLCACEKVLAAFSPIASCVCIHVLRQTMNNSITSI